MEKESIIIIILVLLLVVSLGFNIYQHKNKNVNNSEQYDQGVDPSVECSSTPDSLCPKWCAAGSDYDCCIRKGNEWIEGRGCYT